MKIKNIFLSFLLLLCFSCEEFLDVKPETTLPQANFYTSQTDFEQAITGAYQPLQQLFESKWQLTELRSDNTFFIYNVGNRGGKPTEDLATFTVETNNLILESNWLNNYLIIARANNILSTIDNISFTQSIKDNLKGQALFLRALAYFDLVKNFGGIPLFIVPPTSYNDSFKDRSTAEEVFAQVINDALLAATLLPTKANQGIGKATSGAAYTLLADVYINLKQWANAEIALNSVIGMGYSLLLNYEDIYKPVNKGNAESVFEVGYISGTSQPLFAAFPYSFIPATPDPSVITGVSPANANGGGSLNIPTPDLINAYENQTTDKRFSASITFYSGPGALVGIPTYVNQPYIKKYMQPHSVYGQTNVNWPVYRYAEVLLMMAEVLNEQGKGGAITYLNQIRSRAGLIDKSFVNQTTMRDDIMKERRIEFAFENKRWDDLVRTGNAVSVMNSFGVSVKNNPQNYYYPAGNAPPPNSFQVTASLLLYPIPVSEIIINPQLAQNPGY